MNSNRKAAKIVGVLFILATVTAVIGLNLYDSILFPQISLWGAILAVLVATNEMIIVVWLIGKGINENAIVSITAKNKRRAAI